MLRRLRKLLNHPGFRAEPAAVLTRAALWAGCVALRKRPVFSLTREGERLRVPSDLRYTSVSAFVLRDWSEPELRELHRFVRPGDVFVDVGANIGLYSLKAARLAGPTGRVVAVEPGRTAADLLEENLALNRHANVAAHVAVVRKALSDRSGEATLHHIAAGNDPQAFSLLTDGSAPGAERVETTTLDALAAQLGLPRVDCVKIDVEGAEPLVIDGGREVLTRWRPTIIFEVNSAIALRQAGTADGAWTRLAALGYRFSRLTDGALAPISAFPRDFCNVVAVAADAPKG
ncbi:FkbM family methyltransferase [Arenibaculum pallidiluteum]|uniref:FkbM family methyltransferase n=1 Tax=Arenibaculum pallidiluteum TaxID=2812559 RepID=UPI002E28F2FE|nr:FkbM family methyltransferase [Arenibaculum pallidiluteum]